MKSLVVSQYNLSNNSPPDRISVMITISFQLSKAAWNLTICGLLIWLRIPISRCTFSRCSLVLALLKHVNWISTQCGGLSSNQPKTKNKISRDIFISQSLFFIWKYLTFMCGLNTTDSNSLGALYLICLEAKNFPFSICWT